MVESSEVRRGRRAAILAGTCTGFLLGTLIGLTSSPVVASVVGPLLTTVVAWFGLKDEASEGAKLESESHQAIARRLAVAGFAVACLSAVLLGLFIRVRDVLAPTVTHQVQSWTGAGYSPEDARTIVAWQQAGLLPKGVTAQVRPASDQVRSTVLFSANAELCALTDPARYGDAENLKSAYTAASGPWRAFAEALQGLDSARQHGLLQAAWKVACE